MNKEKKSARQDVAAKIDARVIGMAKLIATERGVCLAEYLSETLKAPVERDYAETMRKLQEGPKPTLEPRPAPKRMA